MQERSQKTQTILVIEDEQDMLLLLRRILESEGYRVILATDGVYGMTLLREALQRWLVLFLIYKGGDAYR